MDWSGVRVVLVVVVDDAGIGRRIATALVRGRSCCGEGWTTESAPGGGGERWGKFFWVGEDIYVGIEEVDFVGQ